MMCLSPGKFLPTDEPSIPVFGSGSVRFTPGSTPRHRTLWQLTVDGTCHRSSELDRFTFDREKAHFPPVSPPLRATASWSLEDGLVTSAAGSSTPAPKRRPAPDQKGTVGVENPMVHRGSSLLRGQALKASGHSRSRGPELLPDAGSRRVDDGRMQRIAAWLAAAVVVTIIFASVYLTLQHTGREAVNNAPAAAVALQLQQIGSDPAGGPRLELTKDSGTFVMLYGPDNKPIYSTVTLHGDVPNLPPGVLDTTRAGGTDAITWQPEPGLRMAVVTGFAAGKVVVAGQSLTPFENADKFTQLVIAGGWLTSMLVLAAAYTFILVIRGRGKADRTTGRPGGD